MKEKIDLIQTTASKPKKISHAVLGELISIVQHRLSPVESYQEIANTIRKEFKVDVAEDDIVRYFTPQICEEETKYYELFGYERTISII